MNLVIDGMAVVVAKGATVLDAARGIGINIPTMCHLGGYAHFTSCMLCVVKDRESGRLIPSCSAPATDGMVIETDSDEVRHARSSALDLLLSEHVGDCEAPCRITCPAHMNIPRMIRQIGAGRMRDAIETVKADIPMPAVLGRVCPAPCEKACRRGRYDTPLAICLLKRYAADADLSGPSSFHPVCRHASGRKVAIVGAGPAGLAAAYYLALAGHACTIIDEKDEAGGGLRYGVSESILPRGVLAGEVEGIRRLGVEFRMNTRVGRDADMGLLRMEFHAIVLAPGKQDAQSAAGWGVAVADDRIVADQHSLATSDTMVFAGGEAVQHGRMAVRAAAHGKIMAIAVDQYLAGGTVTGPVRR
ncbi:MAG: FAD-dependent oxidoreductase, partial [bacterium]